MYAIRDNRDEWLVLLDEILARLRIGQRQGIQDQSAAEADQTPLTPARTIGQPMANATASPIFATLSRLPHESWRQLNLGLSDLESCLMAAPSAGRIDTNRRYLEQLVGALRVVGRVLTEEQLLQTVLDPRSWRLESHFDTWAREFLYRAHPELTVDELAEWMQRQNGEQKQPGGDPVFFRHMADKVLDVCAVLRDATNPDRPRIGAGQAVGGTPPAPAAPTPDEQVGTAVIDWHGLLLMPPLCAAEIAEKLGQPVELVERTLRYFRSQYDYGFIVDDDAGKTTYRYKMPDVLSHLQKWLVKRLKKLGRIPRAES
jgi:hypothetical protein